MRVNISDFWEKVDNWLLPSVYNFFRTLDAYETLKFPTAELVNFSGHFCDNTYEIEDFLYDVAADIIDYGIGLDEQSSPETRPKIVETFNEYGAALALWENYGIPLRVSWDFIIFVSEQFWSLSEPTVLFAEIKTEKVHPLRKFFRSVAAFIL